MKRAVLYAYDFEPITVVELQDWAWEFLHKYGFVNLDVINEPSKSLNCTEPVQYPVFRVHIKAELLIRKGFETLMLFTNDEVSALRLKSAFLPGQRSAVQAIKDNAFAHGFLRALREVGRL